MYRKTLSLSLFCLLVYPFVCPPAWAGPDATRRVNFAERAKNEIMKLGVGPEARVSVKLRDRTTLSGYVSKAEENLFVVTHLKTAESTPVTYADVAQVKGHNLSTGAKIAIGIGIGVGATLLILFLYIAAND